MIQLPKYRHLENQFASVFFSTREAWNQARCSRWPHKYHIEKLMAQILLLVHQDPQRSFPVELLFSQLVGPQPGLVQGVISTHLQDSEFAFAKRHKVPHKPIS